MVDVVVVLHDLSLLSAHDADDVSRGGIIIAIVVAVLHVAVFVVFVVAVVTDVILELFDDVWGRDRGKEEASTAPDPPLVTILAILLLLLHLVVIVVVKFGPVGRRRPKLVPAHSGGADGGGGVLGSTLAARSRSIVCVLPRKRVRRGRKKTKAMFVWRDPSVCVPAIYGAEESLTSGQSSPHQYSIDVMIVLCVMLYTTHVRPQAHVSMMEVII